MSTSPTFNDHEFDVIVVGGGGAGLAAAITAREQGARVALLEKNAALGGSTAWSVGSVTSSSTPHQARKGIVDNAIDHWEDMALFNTGPLAQRDNPELRKILCDEMPEVFHWLLALGIRFYGPMPEPPHRKPRMHNVVPNSRSFIYHLEKRSSGLGVDVRLNAQATALVTKDGRVTGVDVLAMGEELRLSARRGIILAAGDFSNGPEFKKRFMGERAAAIDGLNSSATGDGQAMALTLGGEIINGDLALGPEIRFIPPQRTGLALRLPPWPLLASFLEWSLAHMPDALLRPFIMSFLTTALAPSPNLYEQGAILINKEGRRFCDEREQPAYRIPQQPEQVAYILFDARIARLFSGWPYFISTAPGIAYAYLADYRRNRKDVYAEGASLVDLARGLRMDPTILADTVAQHNSSITNKSDGPSSAPIVQGPFIALGPVRAIFVHNEGGLRITSGMQVVSEDGQPIQGLYAAGANGQGGLLLKGHGHHLAWAFVSGRRAGRIAAANTTPR